MSHPGPGSDADADTDSGTSGSDSPASPPILRVARPTDRLPEIVAMYRDGLGLAVIGGFEGHEGFDGVMLGFPGAPYHLEFTHERGHTAAGAPSGEHLLVFYEADEPQVLKRTEAMTRAGFRQVEPHNPYWARSAHTFEDCDGYRVVVLAK